MRTLIVESLTFMGFGFFIGLVVVFVTRVFKRQD